MATSQAVADVLNETIRMLAVLNLKELHILEDRASVLSESSLVGDDAGMTMILAKMRVLEQLLQGSASNLNAINRLYGRDTRDTWER